MIRLPGRPNKVEPREIAEHFWDKTRNMQHTADHFGVSRTLVHRYARMYKPEKAIRDNPPVVVEAGVDPRIAKIQETLDKHAALELYGFECIMEIRKIMREG